jgi:serine/threonine protein kinase
MSTHVTTATDQCRQNVQPNILLDDGGSARLSDFGVSNIISEVCGAAYFASVHGGAVRWAAPELYECLDDSCAISLDFRSDISSFGSVSLEVSNKIC